MKHWIYLHKGKLIKTFPMRAIIISTIWKKDKWKHNITPSYSHSMSLNMWKSILSHSFCKIDLRKIFALRELISWMWRSRLIDYKVYSHLGCSSKKVKPFERKPSHPSSGSNCEAKNLSINRRQSELKWACRLLGLLNFDPEEGETSSFFRTPRRYNPGDWVLQLIKLTLSHTTTTTDNNNNNGPNVISNNKIVIIIHTVNQ